MAAQNLSKVVHVRVTEKEGRKLERLKRRYKLETISELMRKFIKDAS